MKSLLTHVVATTLMLTAPTFSFAQDAKESQTSKYQDQIEKWIDDLDQKVDLTEDQKVQIRKKVKNHNQRLQSTWEKFNAAHADAIQLEATLYASLEDNMTSEQKEKFRKNREKANHSSETASSQRNRRDQPSSQQRTETSNPKSSDAAGSEHDSAEVFVTTVLIVPVKRAAQNAGLEESQRQTCDKVCHEFHKDLRDSWSKIHLHHAEMVKIEAAKLQAISEVLTEEQLEKMKKERKKS